MTHTCLIAANPPGAAGWTLSPRRSRRSRWLGLTRWPADRRTHAHGEDQRERRGGDKLPPWRLGDRHVCLHELTCTHDGTARRTLESVADARMERGRFD